ncbi:autotransporter outer membrane beta-barrel domain-containing protein [Rickettsiales bacterium]|nr:autotransporter outer membrane beta-barrel domain-containing protein [Rickettsiales bacterium]
MKSKGEVGAALNSLSPSSRGNIVAASNAIGNKSLQIVTTRLASVRGGGSNNSGISTGDSAMEKSVWGQLFTTSANQGYRKNTIGYDYDIFGGTVGVDKKLSDNTIIGISFSYSNADVDSLKGLTDVDSYQFAVYGSRDFDKWYAESVVGVAFNDYDNKRNVTVGSIADVASANYEGLQYNAKISGGYKLDKFHDISITPIASLQYTFLRQDSYTETGSSANLIVDGSDSNSLQSGLGVNVSQEFMAGKNKVIPKLRAMWLYDFVTSDQETSSSFASSPSVSFRSEDAKPARHSLSLGLGADLVSDDVLTISADYDLTLKDSYKSHSGSLKAQLKF